MGPRMPRKNTFATGASEPRTSGAIVEDAQHRVALVARRVGHDEMLARDGIYSGCRGAAANDRHTRRHGFENLVLRAARNPQRRDRKRRTGYERTHVVDRSGDRDAVDLGKPADLLRRLGADDLELDGGPMSLQHREDVGAKVGHALLVG